MKEKKIIERREKLGDIKSQSIHQIILDLSCMDKVHKCNTSIRSWLLFKTTQLAWMNEVVWNCSLSLITFLISFPIVLKRTIDLKALGKSYNFLLGLEMIMLWQPLVTTTNSNTNNKYLNRISSGNHKRTQQGISAVLLPYLYNLHMVCAT